MITFKCKMCGGDLNIIEGNTVCECEFCGTQQTIPTADNEKKASLFNRANRLRMNAEFDKASAVYESIVAEFPEEAEAYWGLCLCAYGIEYVDDPATGEKKPTCHRTVPTSIMEDSNFEQACENADAIARRMYREEAKVIDQIQKDILFIVSKEEPYDVFICYKETAEEGGRTEDSVLAQDIYDSLIGKDLKVFFARITLEDKLGQQYEPYIYAALSSAKVMLAIGTKFEYYDAVWVKNEWMRFLSMMKTQKEKTLIPCYKELDAYDMPKEFKNLQAQDMGKLGWLQDLTRGVMKLCGKGINDSKSTNNEQGQSINNLLKRAEVFIQDGEKEKADEYISKVLDLSPNCSEAFYLRLLNKHGYNDETQLVNSNEDILNDKDYIRAKKFAIGKEREKYISIEKKINSALFRRVGNTVLLGCYTKKENITAMEIDRSNGDMQFINKQVLAEIGKRIEWIVVESKGEKSLLVSKRALEGKPYQQVDHFDSDDERELRYISWADCSLRRWLNAEFFEASFNPDEKAIIQKTIIDNSNDQGYNWNDHWGSTEKSTQDRVFLLSYKEAWKYFPNAKDRICYDDSEASYWWLRSPGDSNNMKDIVDDKGELNQIHYGNDYPMIRPAIWIDLDSPFFEKQHKDDWSDILDESAVKKQLEEKLKLEIKEKENDSREANQPLLDKAIKIMEDAKSYEDYLNALNILNTIHFFDVTDEIATCKERIKELKKIEQKTNNLNSANAATAKLMSEYNLAESAYKEHEKNYKEEEMEREAIQKNIDRLQQNISNAKSNLSNLRGLFIKKKKEDLEVKIKTLSIELNGENQRLNEVESQINNLSSLSPTEPDQNALLYKIATIYHNYNLNEEAIKQLKQIRGFRDAEELLKTIRAEKITQFSTIGNVVTFGRETIEEDDEESARKDDAEWIVLDTQENKSLLLSRLAFRCNMPFHTENSDITWETSSLRKWLNGEFKKSVFSQDEQNAILSVIVDNSKSQGYERYNTSGGSNTRDQIYLLSYQEVFNKYLTNAEDRIYLRHDDYDDVVIWKKSAWWLRSPGDTQNKRIVVSGKYFLSESNDASYVCIRPALWIDLNSDYFQNS